MRESHAKCVRLGRFPEVGFEPGREASFFSVNAYG